MRAKLDRDLVYGTLPSHGFISTQAENSERILWRATIAKHARAFLTADGDSLVPLDRAQVIGNRGGHLRAPLFLATEHCEEPSFETGGRHTERYDITTRNRETRCLD